LHARQAPRWVDDGGPMVDVGRGSGREPLIDRRDSELCATRVEERLRHVWHLPPLFHRAQPYGCSSALRCVRIASSRCHWRRRACCRRQSSASSRSRGSLRLAL
jgi:hypothetical protein